MERAWSITKLLLPRLPYLTLLTALTYSLGVAYRNNYWKAVGLPLMATDKPFAEILYEGFMGAVLVFGKILSLHSPSAALFALATLYAVGKLAARRIVRRIDAWAESRAALRKDRTARSTRILRIVDVADELFSDADSVVGPGSSVILIVLLGLLAFLVPWQAVGQEGARQGREAMSIYEASARQLRDGLVDVSVVSVRRFEDGAIIRAIPMECEGNRCSALTQDGPISLPQDHFLEESVERAVWDETCRKTPLTVADKR